MGKSKRIYFDIWRDRRLVCRCLTLVAAQQKLKEIQAKADPEYGGLYAIRRVSI